MSLRRGEHSRGRKAVPRLPGLAVDRLDRPARPPRRRGRGHALGDEVISPYYLWCLQDGFVARAHEEALGVLPWTVNEPSDLDAVREAGVDGPVTDYPDRVALPRPA